jgi:outer membrane protein assembly factor BamB
VAESLEDHLRRATRNFTARLPEDQVFALGRDLARELARAHAERPPRFPEVEPSAIAMVNGSPRLEGGRGQGSEADDLFALGALVHWLASGEKPDVSWRLDGPPSVEASTIRRRAALAAVASPRGDGYRDAAEAAAAFDRALATDATAPAAWPLFRGGTARTGSASAPGQAASLAAHWQAAVGPVVSSPLLAGDLVVAASGDGRILYLDRATGTRVHETRVGSAIESSPAVAERSLYVGTDDGELVALDLVDGRVLYRARLGEVVRSSPLVEGNCVYVGAVEARDSGSLVALDAHTGKAVWKRKLGAVFSSPALASGLVLVGSDDERLHAVDPGKGEVVWSRPLSGRVRATPAVLGERAVVADFKGRVAAVNVKDGSVLWTRDLPQAVYSSAALTPALAIVGCHDGHVYALSLDTGAPVFDLRTGGPVVSSPIAVGDQFLAASTDGHLYLFDAAGKTQARLAIANEGIQSSPASDATGLVIGSARGLHAVTLGS